MSDSFSQMGAQKLPSPSLYLRVCSSSCPLSQRRHPTISPSVAHFSSCPQSFLASESFPKSQLFTSGGQSIGASASPSVLPKNTQGWFPILLNLLAVQGTDESSIVPQFESINSLVLSLLYGSKLTCVHVSHICIWLLEKKNKHSFDYIDLFWESHDSAF